jgi:hypothetical protein
MKKTYEALELTVICFDHVDVITDSDQGSLPLPEDDPDN